MFVVSAPPVITDAESNYNVSKGHPLSIEISFYSVESTKVNVTFRDDTDLVGMSTTKTTADVFPLFYGRKVTVAGSKISITSNKILEGNFGKYKVVIENSIGQETIHFDINPQGKIRSE